MAGPVQTAFLKLRSLHPLQLVYLANGIFGLIASCLLIGTATNIKVFVTGGSEANGFGNFSTFGYPATYVYMFIPAISSCVYSFILMCDHSPAYSGWKPSKTFVSSVGLMFGSLVFAALFPALPGADVIVKPNSALSCTWADYMQWRIIFNNPDIYPWVSSADAACTCLRAADAFCWLLVVGWAVALAFCIRAARRHVPASLNEKYVQEHRPPSTLSPTPSVKVYNTSNKHFVPEGRTY